MAAHRVSGQAGTFLLSSALPASRASEHSPEIALLSRYFHWEQRKISKVTQWPLPLKGIGSRNQSLDKKSSKTNLILLLGTRKEGVRQPGSHSDSSQLHPVPSVSKVPTLPLPRIRVPRFYVLFLSSADSMDLVGSFKGFNEFFKGFDGFFSHLQLPLLFFVYLFVHTGS